MSIVEGIYQALILLLSPVAAFIFIFFKRGRARLAERFGLWKRDSESHSTTSLWVHAASNGEVRGLLPLLRQLRSDYPQLHIMLTATSVSAFDLLGGMKMELHLVPFDSYLLYRQAFRGRKFKALLIAETEIWPGMLMLARREGIPVVVVNARISDYSVAVYRVLSPLLKHCVASIQRVCCADSLSTERFRMIGAPRVELTGNMKYDATPSITSSEDKQKLRSQFPLAGENLVVLGSLRPGEETIWLRALAELSHAGVAPGCILAPRHLEKAGYFVQKIREQGLAVSRFSELTGQHADRMVDIVVLDTFGLLERCYSLGLLAFIGGSLVDIGGHNPLEAAAYGVAIAMGPFDSTVREVTQQLESANAIIRLTSDQNVTPLLESVVRADAKLLAHGARAQAVWKLNQGATLRVLNVLREEGMLSKGASEQ